MRTIRLFLSAACICRVGSGFARPGVVVVVGVVGGRGESHASAFSSRMTDDGDDGTTTTTTTSSSATTTPIDDGIDRSTTVPPASVATTPLSSSTLAGRVERALLAEFSSTNKIDRVLASWRYLDAGYEHREYVGGGVDDDENDRNDEGTSSSSSKSKRSTSRCYQHAPSYVPGLKAKTWWDDHVDDASWAKILSRSYAAIRDEFVNVALSKPDGLKMAGNNVWAGALTSDAESYGEGWKTLVLLNRGQWDVTNANLFPVTSRALRQSGVPVVEAFFACMAPRSSIRPHSDFTNFVLTCHLPLVVPMNGMNKCRLSVGDETQQWIEGKLVLFDTSIYHDAINDADDLRYVLMMRLWHPELTSTEIEALQFVYDCLEVPDLLSEDKGTVEAARRYARSMKDFPSLSSSSSLGGGGGAGGGGFGGGSGGRKRRGDDDGGRGSSSSGRARRKGGGGRGFGP